MAASIGASTATADTPIDVSFSAINSFEDRQNALVIKGIDKTSGMERTLSLYRFDGPTEPGGASVFDGSADLLSDTNVRHTRCYDYLLKMLDEPGKYSMNFHLTLRDDLNDFSRDSSDQIDACDLERQSPTLPPVM